MLFRTQNESVTPRINLKLNGIPIEEKQDAKYLGVIIDHKLSFSGHIKQVKSRLIKGNTILYKVRHFLPSHLLTNTYYAHIQPHIDYGLNLYGYAAETHIKDVIVQQKKAIRIMCFKKYRETTEPLFTNKNILPFHKNLQRRIRCR